MNTSTAVVSTQLNGFNYCYLILIILIDINHLLGGGACGVMFIVVGSGHDDSSSNPGRDWLHFT